LGQKKSKEKFIAALFGQNITETYPEYYIRQLESGKAPLSPADHNRNKMACMGLVAAKIDSLTTTDAGLAILGGMSHSMQIEAVRIAKSMALGTAVRYAVPYVAGAIAPEALAVGYAGMAIYSLYQNGGAVIQTGADLAQAIKQQDYAQVGNNLVGFTLSITAFGDSTKNAVVHFKNLPDLCTALSERFKLNNVQLAGVPGNFAASAKPQSNSSSRSSNKPTTQKALPQSYIPSKINGVYKDAKYHHQNSKGPIKSPCPKNGQRALDISVAVKNDGPESMIGKRRIAVCDGEFVLFDRDNPGIFHGHVRELKDLTKEMRQALEEAGLINNRGKIL
jgi:hypothetical protein